MTDNISAIDILVTDFLEHLEVERGLSPLTIRNYHLWLRRFTQWAVNANSRVGVADIDSQMIRKFRVWLARRPGRAASEMKLATQGYHMIALRSFLKWCAKCDIKAISPEKIDVPRARSRSLKFLTVDDMQRLLAGPTGQDVKAARDRAILEVLFSTGLRVSELVGLNRDQIDLDRREFSVIGKGGHSRVVFLSQRAGASVDRYLRLRSDHYVPVFLRIGGKKINPSTPDSQVRLTARSVERLVEHYRKKVGIAVKISPHGIRHTFATDLLRGGADLREVQELLGHRSVTTTQIYTHITNRQLRDVHTRSHSGNK